MYCFQSYVQAAASPRNRGLVAPKASPEQVPNTRRLREARRSRLWSRSCPPLFFVLELGHRLGVPCFSGLLPLARDPAHGRAGRSSWILKLTLECEA